MVRCVCTLECPFEERISSRRSARGRGLPFMLVASVLAASNSKAQVVPPPLPAQDSVTVITGEVYEAGALFRALSGSGYRNLWTTPIRVPVADLSTLGGGGLTAVEVGGGTTTQTLHLRGADGHRYVFRSVDKTPIELIEDLEGTPAEAIIQDQMSSFHPSGALVVARLLDAVGVLHPYPELMVVPDDPRLGEFREQFAGMLVLFEERPDDLPEGEAGFAGSTRIVQTDDLFDELEEDPANQIQLRELLRARLVDIFVGDRDRSVNNHLWARFDDGDGYLWRPIPRDRDQSFVQLDGLLKAVARRYDPRLVSFRDEYANTRAVTRNAWDIDRNFLVGLDRATWDSTVREVVSSLTNDVIREAVARMPREHQAIFGAEFEATLRQRRRELPRVAEEFYEIVFRHSDVHATDVDEIALVEGLRDGGVRLALYRRAGSVEPEDTPYFDRMFSPEETRELRLYLHGGDDRTIVRGTPSSPITIRVLGGGGADELVNTGGPSVRFYDAGNRTVSDGPGVDLVLSSPSRPFSWFEDSYDLDWGGETMLLPGLSYDEDRGLVPIFGFRHTQFGFAKRPYAYRFRFKGGWALSRSNPLIESSLRVRRALAGADLNLEVLFSGLEIVNFFGFGNEVEADQPEAFYEVSQGQLRLAATLGVGEGERWGVHLGPVLKRVASDTVAPTLLADSRPFGTRTLSQVGLSIEAAWDGRDLPGAPTEGFRVEGGAEYYPAVADLENAFGFAYGEVAGYLTPSWGNPTLAARIGGKKLWGEFPYYEAAFLGGAANLRGLPEERFAGDASLYGSVELRAFLTRLTFILPIDMGVFGLTDAGRTYFKGESSGKWYVGRGAGVWFAPLNRSATARVSLAWSEGRRAIYGGAGFAF